MHLIANGYVIEKLERNGANMNIEQAVLKEFTDVNVVVCVSDMVEHILSDTRGGYACDFTCNKTENYMPADDADELREVFNWYIVSEELLNALRDLDAVTIPEYNVWGRETIGQPVYMDNIISNAYKLIKGVE